MADRTDHLNIFNESCSCTMFDLHVRVQRDGRERGLWVGLKDKSEARAETYKQWLNDNVDLVAKFMGFDEDKSTKFRLFMNMNSEIGSLLNKDIDESALLEWPEVIKLYNVIGGKLKERKLLFESCLHREAAFRSGKDTNEADWFDCAMCGGTKLRTVSCSNTGCEYAMVHLGPCGTLP